ncbi:hypothetical protein [Streptomyces sp. NPDC094472]|uniref:hypothetical protein n=1 Tax=unclassified Streptomyces TaxID=2593676 RepID=UPI0033169E1C
MGGAAGGALAAAVSRAGGLGLLGGAFGDRAWLEPELPIVAEGADQPWGVRVLCWAIDQDDVARGVIPPLPVWAGEGVDLITDVPSAADLVTEPAAQAEDALLWAGRIRPNDDRS